MRLIGIFLVFVLIVSCSSRQPLLEDFVNHPVKFAKQKISYPTNEFTLYIPQNWSWKVEQYDNQNTILGIDAGSQPDKDGFIDLISIQKVKSLGGKSDLKSEFDYLINLSNQQTEKMKVVESGETKIFKQEAYFIHTKSATGTYGESEMISFILDGETKGTFYYLNAGASQTKELKKNMAILIQSLRTFEQNKSE